VGKEAGALSLRDKTKAAILSIRGLRAREVKEKLFEIGESTKRTGKLRRRRENDHEIDR